jgi:hypothetical protein
LNCSRVQDIFLLAKTSRLPTVNAQPLFSENQALSSGWSSWGVQFNTLEKDNWHIEFTWIKAHAGHTRNELADKLAKEATNNREICFNKIPKSEIVRLEHQKSIAKWQKQWDDSNKGWVTKEYFPEVKERLKKKINLSPNFTVMVTAHGKTKAYLHRFKIIQSSECFCVNGDQTVDHLIFNCPKLDKESENITAHTSREEDWPVWKCYLVNKYLNQLSL